MKIKFYVLFFFVVIFIINGCARRDKVDSFLFITITPSFVNVLSNTQIQFKAEVKNQEGNNLDSQVNWYSTMGTISKNGLYIAPVVSIPTTVKITASIGAISRSINIRVLNEIPITKNIYYFYSDEIDYNNPYVPRLKFDTSNPSDNNGGYLGKIGGNELSFSSSNSTVYEGFESLKLSFLDSVGGVGIYFQFGYDGVLNNTVIKDLSNYNTLKFAFKAENFNTTSFLVRVETSNSVIENIINPNNYRDWGIITIPNLQLGAFKKLLFLTNSYTSGTFYIDDIYFCTQN